MSTCGSKLGNIVCDQPSAKKNTGLDGPHWGASHTCPMLSVIVVAKQAGVRIMKEYFEIEVLKSTSQYGFRKGPYLFGDEGY